MIFRSTIATLALGAAAFGDDFFATKIEPLLKSRCYDCHSHAAGKMKGGLTLDSRSGWAEGGDSGPAVVAGKPDESLLVKMVRWSDDDHRMPPKEKLPAEEVALLEEWVRRGAHDPRAVKPTRSEDWWSLKPLVRPQPPGRGHPVDAFLRAALARKNLAPSPEADRRTLARRLFYDLTGLPPSPDEVAELESGAASYEALVDRLLASPRHGERWARHWMDTIHFADSHGFEHDVLRENAWRYRDYLVASLNTDKPWPRFIREQLAADFFFPAEPTLAVALGFLGAGTYDVSAAGTAPVSFEYLDRDDLVTQTMAAFTSTTANCARCHAHKFDPITQEDYFALQAVFAGVGKGDIFFDEDAAIAARRARWSALANAAQRNDSTALLAPENAPLVEAWEKERGPAVQWTPLVPETFTSAEGTTLGLLPDGSVLSSGKRPDKDTFTLTFPINLPATALRCDLLPHDSLPMRGPGRQDNGNLHITEFDVALHRGDASKPEKAAIRRATSDFDQVGFGVAKTVDGDPKTSWAIHPNVGAPHHAVLELAAPLAVQPGAKLVVAVPQLQGQGHLVGRLLFSATSAPNPGAAALPAAVEAVLVKPAESRAPEERLLLAATVLRTRAAAELAALPPQAAVWAASKSAKNERGVIAIAAPRKIHVLRRGDLDKPGAEASPGALSAIAAMPARFSIADSKDEAARRAALADWLADPRNPLTWRSVVNRVWHHHFGRGLCDTPNDFGRMGGVPSDAALLDWLAVWFRDDAKGSLKALHRLLVTSAAYRQSSAFRTDAAAVDPDNRLLWRMNRTRLDADCVRDSVFAVSGALDLTTGGPGVKHFKTLPGIQSTPVLDYTAFDWASPGASRRSIYRVVWRGIADPFMEALDFPDMGMLAPTRGFSASPLQSLVLMNNDLMLHHCGRIAARLERLAPGASGQVRHAFRLALQRVPTEEESEAFTALAEKAGPAAACRVLFNSNEFLFLD